ncbi:MAG: calcium-translocating P-type ATPase, SERCA-type [Nanoarchaeota archaeon]|nr:calcium-translocating P-type ATPase, SERCA-type [Nanoarchaeota archaeon]
MPNFYKSKTKELLKEFKTSLKGLSALEAKKRLKEYGLNKIGKERKIPILKIALNQLNDPLLWILFFAIIVSLVIQHYIDAFVILAIVLFNAIFGFFQEFKAEKAIEHLRTLQESKTEVLRNNKILVINSTELVPGDIILLEEGDKVPADARLFEVVDLKVDEASLTGESNPVTKTIKIINKAKALGDQTNMVFTGTIVVSGRGKAIVVNTGTKTELGKIAHEIETIEEEITPLQKRLKEIGKWLTIFVTAICILIFTLGIARGFLISDMFLMAISLAVAAIPEGLPAVVTITLALGLKKMLKRKALIRKLRSVETLGSVTVICSDKTGTLTKNEMTVTKIFANKKEYDVTGIGYSVLGKILFKKKESSKELTKLLTVSTTCNNATIEIGDPTERALKVLAEKINIKAIDRVSEVPFSSDSKFMSVTDKNKIQYMKGALEVVLKKCSYIEINGKKRKLTAKDKKEIFAKNAELSKEALRVLAIAYGKKNLIFLGLVGMIDPPREEVKQSIALCKDAGIRAVMITGDHKLTAEAVAKEVGIQGDSLEGIELDGLSDKQLRKLVKTVSIYSRVNSLHKARILKSLQSNGEIVAMTGDGVNDAPAIKQSNVGIAMNIKGTEITKDVSDLILLDDNFATIVAAVEEGRTIYNNIKKFVKYLLAANFGEIAIITLPILFGFPLPMLPVQILWINLVTDSFPALALGADPANPNIMKKKPRNPNESFFVNTKTFMFFATIISTLVTLGIFLYYLNQEASLDTARTVAFTTLIMFELFLVFSCRSDTSSLFKLKNNIYLIGAVFLSLILHLLLIYTPLSVYFSLTALTFQDWILIVPLASIGFLFFEIKKFVKRKK